MRTSTDQLIQLFYQKLQEHLEIPANEVMKISQWFDRQNMKQVISFFAEHRYPADEPRRFILWFFKAKVATWKAREETPKITWLRPALQDYLVSGASPKPSPQGGIEAEQQEARRAAMQSDLEFFGLGFKYEEHTFTKYEYWLGIWWRSRMLDRAQVQSYTARQDKALVDRLGELDAGVYAFRFREWEKEYESRREAIGPGPKWKAFMRDVFIQVQSRRRKWTYGQTRQHYGL